MTLIDKILSWIDGAEIKQLEQKLAQVIERHRVAERDLMNEMRGIRNMDWL